MMLALLHRSEHVWEVKSMWILKKEYALVIQILHVKMLCFFRCDLWGVMCEWTSFKSSTKPNSYKITVKKKINLDEKIKEKQGRGTRLST